ncbi:MAG TPA: hypothetical protein VFX59_26790 [Polyangiales bacterium]|nr:hypothetical protein [Polyangiales bacterium]
MHADAGGIAASVGITSADGSVRTRTGVRLSITAAPGAPDRVVAMGAPVQARMASVRDCFASAMLRSPGVEGFAEFELESTRAGARVRITANETGDSELASCMRSSLSRAQFTAVPRGSRARVGLLLSNPVAALQQRMHESQMRAQVKVAGGRAASEGGTSAGDIKFRVTGTAQSAKTIGALQTDINANLAGLLDCRRKASKHGEATGSVEMELHVRAGEIDHANTKSTLRRGAPQCVESWLSKLDSKRLADADVQLAINFAGR